MSKILKNLFIGFISFSLISSIIVLAILWNFSNNIPDYKFLKNYKPPVSSKVYSGNGDLVADFSKEKRIFVPYGSIPKNVINAFLSAEDKNFFSHPGVDAKGVLRAIVNNIKNVLKSKKFQDYRRLPDFSKENLRQLNKVWKKYKPKEYVSHA